MAGHTGFQLRSLRLVAHTQMTGLSTQNPAQTLQPCVVWEYLRTTNSTLNSATSPVGNCQLGPCYMIKLFLVLARMKASLNMSGYICTYTHRHFISFCSSDMDCQMLITNMSHCPRTRDGKQGIILFVDHNEAETENEWQKLG